MPVVAGGTGRIHGAKASELIRASFGPQLPTMLDLNKAKLAQLGAHPLIGKALAAKIVELRKKKRITTPGDLFHAGLIGRRQLRDLDAFAFGEANLRALLQGVEIDGPLLYVGEPFALRFAWRMAPAAPPEILSITVRFPSGRAADIHVRLSKDELAAGKLVVPGFVSGESGELYVLTTLRDSLGRVSMKSAMFGVFTRNPVQIYVTPQSLTQSGNAGAPQYNFELNRWECSADVRWVNGESYSVNLGRRIDVLVTDAGIGTVTNFSFNVTSDVVLPAFSTVYGSLSTWHSSGGVFDEFSAKGDLTFQYSMSGSGFTPSRTQVWRTMRTIGYNIIRVGDFTSAERVEYQRAAAEVASGIFQSRDMTVYGVELYRIEGTQEMDADKTRCSSTTTASSMRWRRSTPCQTGTWMSSWSRGTLAGMGLLTPTPPPTRMVPTAVS